MILLLEITTNIIKLEQDKIFSAQLIDSLTIFWTNGLILYFLLFCLGLIGILFNYRNYLVTMLCIEIMYLGITICFILVSIALFDSKGQIYGLSLLIIAAAESAVGLGLLVVLYRFGGSINFSEYQSLKG